MTRVDAPSVGVGLGCGRCGAPLDDGDLFCGDCGVPVGASCPTCGEPLTPGKRFCRRCGAALFETVPAPAPVSRAAPESAAERRMCSVLFCDVVGFTPLSEARDPEAVRELLSQYFGVARTVIGRYGGVVEKFIGDAVMAVWGTRWRRGEHRGSGASGRRAGSAAGAASAIAEARDIAGRLRCQPLLDRAAVLTPRDSATAAPQDSPRVAR